MQKKNLQLQARSSNEGSEKALIFFDALRCTYKESAFKEATLRKDDTSRHKKGTASARLPYQSPWKYSLISIRNKGRKMHDKLDLMKHYF